MPQRRQVLSLKILSSRIVGCTVERAVYNAVNNVYVNEDIQQVLDYLDGMLISVPHCLYESIVTEVVEVVERLVLHTSPCIKKMKILGEINGVLLKPQLKSLKIIVWPLKVTRNFCPNMKNLTGLEKLELVRIPDEMRSKEICSYISESISAMTKLKSFTFNYSCTDVIVQAIGNHCRDIEYLDIKGSHLVTNRSIPQFLKCSKLKILKIRCTEISYDGMAQIIIGLPNLIEADYWDYNSVVKRLKNLGCGPFGLRKALSCNYSIENLNVFLDMFPKTECIVFSRPIADLPILSSLANLKTLNLRHCEIYGDYLKQLLKVRGGNITSLYLDPVSVVDIQHIMDIGRYCPNLKTLGMITCRFTNTVMLSDRFDESLFKNLRKVYYMGRGGMGVLEFVLSHALHIQVIDVTYLNESITHSFVENVLSANPMRDLEEFSVSHSTHLTMRTVEILLASCVNLKVLSCLEKWRGIRKRELEVFKKYIAFHNFDLRYVCSPRPAEVF